jgi:hypothetical protein
MRDDGKGRTGQDETRQENGRGNDGRQERITPNEEQIHHEQENNDNTALQSMIEMFCVMSDSVWFLCLL